MRYRCVLISLCLLLAVLAPSATQTAAAQDGGDAACVIDETTFDSELDPDLCSLIDRAITDSHPLRPKLRGLDPCDFLACVDGNPTVLESIDDTEGELEFVAGSFPTLRALNLEETNDQRPDISEAEELTVGLKRLTNLEYLRLREAYPGQPEVPIDFTPLQKLRFAWFANQNDFADYSPSLYQLPALEYLAFDRQVGPITGAVDLPALRVLRATFADIDTIMDGAPMLEELQTGAGGPAQFERMTALPNLDSLHLSYIDESRLDGIDVLASQLTTLGLRGNRPFPPQVAQLTELRILDLQYWFGPGPLPDALAQLPDLEAIYLPETRDPADFLPAALLARVGVDFTTTAPFSSEQDLGYPGPREMLALYDAQAAAEQPTVPVVAAVANPQEGPASITTAPPSQTFGALGFGAPDIAPVTADTGDVGGTGGGAVAAAAGTDQVAGLAVTGSAAAAPAALATGLLALGTTFVVGARRRAGR